MLLLQLQSTHVVDKQGLKRLVSHHCPLGEPDRSRYLDKVALCDGIDPYLLDSKQLTVDVNLWPAVQNMDIVAYLVLTTHSVTLQQMKAYKSLESHNFFTSGWVHPNISVRVLTGDRLLVVAKVTSYYIIFQSDKFQICLKHACFRKCYVYMSHLPLLCDVDHCYFHFACAVLMTTLR